MTATKDLPASLIQAFKASQEAHSAMRRGTFKTNKLRKIANNESEMANEIYRRELFAFTGVDDQKFFNETVESLYSLTRE